MQHLLIPLLCLVPTFYQESPTTTKVIPELRDALLTGEPAQTYRVYAALDEMMTYADFAGRVESLPRGVRQRFVMNELRAFAEPRQAGLLEQLTALQSQGHVERITPLWINNCVVFHGTAHAIEAVAARPEVSYVGWDPYRAPEEYWDAPALPAATTTYYTEGFESGSFGAEWVTQTTGCGRIQVTTQQSPVSGSYHAMMDSYSNGCYGTAAMQLSVDLSSASALALRFEFKDMDDEFDPGQDILEASDDGGATWVKVGDLTATDGLFVTMTYDLSALGLTPSSSFLIRWRWYDNYQANTDGFCIDDIEIADTFPPPPPPSPEPNLVKLQAPDLWQLGITGQGALILNIDSGAEYTHPDLINRIWSNPLDPVDGVDNDGNGYTDDTMGWDFEYNDNDPWPSSYHGTATAGIMVGDGSAGVYLTGMAPGAQMAIARVSGETDHWSAQQWGISVGIDCSSSSHSYKWYFSPRPDYHRHRGVEDMVLAAGIVHANSIGNSFGDPSAPTPFNISAPGLCPAPWRHDAQTQDGGGVSGVMACGGIELNNTHYNYSSEGPSAWEDIQTYSSSYSHPQDSAYWDYPAGGWSTPQQGLLKPDVVTYTNVVTTDNGNGYNSSFGGTSAATPHLGGALALMVSANPNAMPRQICKALQTTAIDMGAVGKDNLYGAGRIQVKDAALRLFHLVAASDLTPSVGSTITVTMSGPANALFRTYWSFTPGTTVLPFGTLELGGMVRTLVTASLDAAGLYSMPVTIPNSASLIGKTVYAQSVADDLAGATSSVLFSLVEEVVLAP